MKPTKLFVYGILIGTQVDVTPAYMLNKEKYLCQGYYTIRRKKGSIVEGEIINNVTDKDLDVYDLIEGVKYNFYRRYITTVKDFSGNDVTVWVYKQVEDKK